MDVYLSITYTLLYIYIYNYNNMKAQPRSGSNK